MGSRLVLILLGYLPNSKCDLGDCSPLIEKWASWGTGASWNIRYLPGSSNEKPILIEFDRPLSSLDVFNGEMETSDMSIFKITPDQYQKDKDPLKVVHNFLIKYDPSSSPAFIKSIEIDGKKTSCNGGNGKRTDKTKMKYLTAKRSGVHTNDAQERSQSSDSPSTCNGSQGCADHNVTSSTACKGRTCKSSFIYHITHNNDCVPDKSPLLCPFMKDSCLLSDRIDWMRFNCFSTCYCPLGSLKVPGTTSTTTTTTTSPTPKCIATDPKNAKIFLQCHFPFKYKDKTYNECTTLNNSGVAWCAAKVDQHGVYIGGEWGKCPGSCTIISE